jgi:hypothetical protein
VIFALGLSKLDKLTSGLRPSDRRENPDWPGDEALPICDVRRVAAAAPPETRAERRLRGCAGEDDVATGIAGNRELGTAAGSHILLTFRMGERDQVTVLEHIPHELLCEVVLSRTVHIPLDPCSSLSSNNLAMSSSVFASQTITMKQFGGYIRCLATCQSNPYRRPCQAPVFNDDTTRSSSRDDCPPPHDDRPEANHDNGRIRSGHRDRKV